MVQEEEAKQVEWLAVHFALPGDVLGHHGVEAVEEVGSGHGEGEERKEELRPATVRGVAEVARLAVEGDDQLHVQG